MKLGKGKLREKGMPPHQNQEVSGRFIFLSENEGFELT
jgi:hypothetical protein